MLMPGGHLVILHDGQSLLLNTGCPVSMGTRPSFAFLDREIPVLQRYHGMSVAQWSEIIGVNIDGLLGSDVLGRYAVAIDPEVGRVIFDENPFPGLRACVAPSSTVAGLPVLEVGLGGRRIRVLFHTGATLSCLRDADTNRLPCVGVSRDYYPELGEFATELRRVPFLFGDQQVSLVCGLMPYGLERALGAVNVTGLVGTNLVREFALAWSPGFRDLSLVRRTAATPTPVDQTPYDTPSQIGYAS
jgi:hypothetical protein